MKKIGNQPPYYIFIPKKASKYWESDKNIFHPSYRKGAKWVVNKICYGQTNFARPQDGYRVAANFNDNNFQNWLRKIKTNVPPTIDKPLSGNKFSVEKKYSNEAEKLRDAFDKFGFSGNIETIKKGFGGAESGKVEIEVDKTTLSGNILIKFDGQLLGTFYPIDLQFIGNNRAGKSYDVSVFGNFPKLEKLVLNWCDKLTGNISNQNLQTLEIIETKIGLPRMMQPGAEILASGCGLTSLGGLDVSEAYVLNISKNPNFSGRIPRGEIGYFYCSNKNPDTDLLHKHFYSESNQKMLGERFANVQYFEVEKGEARFMVLGNGRKFEIDIDPSRPKKQQRIQLKEVVKTLPKTITFSTEEINQKKTNVEKILQKNGIKEYSVQLISPDGTNILKIEEGKSIEKFKLASLMKLYAAYYYLKAMQEASSFNQKQKIEFAVDNSNNLYIRGNLAVLLTENFKEIKQKLKAAGITKINNIYFDDQFPGKIDVPDGAKDKGAMDIQSSVMCNWELKDWNPKSAAWQVAEELRDNKNGGPRIAVQSQKYRRGSFPDDQNLKVKRSFVDEHYTPVELVQTIFKHSNNIGANFLLLRAAHLKYPNIKDKNELWEKALQDLDNLIDQNVEYDPKDGSGFYFANKAMTDRREGNQNPAPIPISKVAKILQKYQKEFPNFLPTPKLLNGLNLYGKTGTVRSVAHFAGFDANGNMILIFLNCPPGKNMTEMQNTRKEISQQFNGPKRRGEYVPPIAIKQNETADETAIQNFLQNTLGYTGNFADFKNAFEPGATFKMVSSPAFLEISHPNGGTSELVKKGELTFDQIKNVNILEKFPSLESVNIFDANGGNFKTFTKLNNLKFLRINSGQSLNVPTDFIFPRGNLEDFRINDKFHYLEEKYYQDKTKFEKIKDKITGFQIGKDAKNLIVEKIITNEKGKKKTYLVKKKSTENRLILIEESKQKEEVDLTEFNEFAKGITDPVLKKEIEKLYVIFSRKGKVDHNSVISKLETQTHLDLKNTEVENLKGLRSLLPKLKGLNVTGCEKLNWKIDAKGLQYLIIEGVDVKLDDMYDFGGEPVGATFKSFKVEDGKLREITVEKDGKPETIAVEVKNKRIDKRVEEKESLEVRRKRKKFFFVDAYSDTDAHHSDHYNKYRQNHFTKDIYRKKYENVNFYRISGPNIGEINNDPDFAERRSHSLDSAILNLDQKFKESELHFVLPRMTGSDTLNDQKKVIEKLKQLNIKSVYLYEIGFTKKSETTAYEKLCKKLSSEGIQSNYKYVYEVQDFPKINEDILQFTTSGG